MKTGNVTIMFLIVLFLAGATFGSTSQSANPRPFIGIQLDSATLPELLTMHLGLSAGQGIRIINVQRNSVADQAGLERDDIIVGFQGQVVDDNDKFVEDVQKAGIDAEVSLEIIHLGQRKTVKLKLKAFDEEAEWKYPSEPQVEQLWQPGRIFRRGPQDQQWVEVTDDFQIAGGVYTLCYDDGKEQYTITIRHSPNNENITLTLKGSPDDEDSTITIYTGANVYSTIVKELEKLPEQYRQATEKALQFARQYYEQGSQNRRLIPPGLQSPPSTLLQKLKDYVQKNPLSKDAKISVKQQLTDKIGGQSYEKVQEQMKQLQEQISELQKSLSEMRDGLAEQIKEQKQQDSQE